MHAPPPPLRADIVFVYLSHRPARVCHFVVVVSITALNKYYAARLAPARLFSPAYNGAGAPDSLAEEVKAPAERNRNGIFDVYYATAARLRRSNFIRSVTDDDDGWRGGGGGLRFASLKNGRVVGRPFGELAIKKKKKRKPGDR